MENLHIAFTHLQKGMNKLNFCGLDLTPELSDFKVFQKNKLPLQALSMYITGDSLRSWLVVCRLERSALTRLPSVMKARRWLCSTSHRTAHAPDSIGRWASKL